MSGYILEDEPELWMVIPISLTSFLFNIYISSKEAGMEVTVWSRWVRQMLGQGTRSTCKPSLLGDCFSFSFT